MEDLSSGEGAVELSEPQLRWLAEEATRHDLDPGELLEALIVAYEQATTEDAAYVDAEELADLQAEYQDLLEDVRERVIQVKREVDGKAPEDHRHPAFEKRVGAVEETLTVVETALDEVRAETNTLEADLTELSQTVDGGFDNYEAVLESLLDQTETLEDRLDTLAQAVLDARSRLREVSSEQREQELLAELKADANREGINTAQCDSCRGSVNLGMLTTPRCPHCSTSFTGLGTEDRLGGLLTEHRLRVGNHPELTGSTRPAIDEEIADDIGETADTPTVASQEDTNR